MPQVDAPAEQAITHEGEVVGFVAYYPYPLTRRDWMARYQYNEFDDAVVFAKSREAAIAWLMEQHAKSLVKEGE